MDRPPKHPLLVFVDTEVFRALSFDWNAPELESLRKRVAKGSIVVLTTDIIVQEIRRQQQGLLNEFIQALNKTRDKSRFLKSTASDVLENLILAHQTVPTIEAIQSSTGAFFKSIGAKLLPYPGSVDELFGLYFTGAAPFGAKGKKSEFPDAANFLSLLRHAKLTGQEIYVVSADDDWERVCSKTKELLNLKTLGEALRLGISLEWQDATLWSDDELVEHMKQNGEALSAVLKNALRSESRVNLGDGRLDWLEIWSITPLHFVTTDVWQRSSIVTCRGDLTYVVDFAADISLGDPELDNELEQAITGRETLVAAVEIEFSPDKPEQLTFISASHQDALELELDMSF